MKITWGMDDRELVIRNKGRIIGRYTNVYKFKRAMAILCHLYKQFDQPEAFRAYRDVDTKGKR